MFLGAWQVRLWLFVIIKFVICRCLVISFISLVHILFPLLSELHFAHRCVTAIVDYFMVKRHFFDRLALVTSHGWARISVASAESIPFEAILLVTIVRIVVLLLTIIKGVLNVHITPLMVHNSTADGSLLGIGVLVRACCRNGFSLIASRCTTSTSTTPDAVMLQSLELLVGIPQVLVFSLVDRLSDLAVLPSRGKILSEEVDRRCLTQVLLECFLRRLSHRYRSLPIIHQFLLVVEKLALEARIRVDHLTF